MHPVFDRTLAMPSAFHEVLGHQQKVWHLGLIVSISLLALLWWWPWLERLEPVALWRQLLATALFLDVVAGAIANLTPGTNRFYAERPPWRWGFIAIHWHIVILAWLLGQPLLPFVLLTLYTLAVASLVNVLYQHSEQRLVAGTGLCLGLALVPLLSLPAWAQVLGLVFLFKVAFSFAVDHYRQPREVTAHVD